MSGILPKGITIVKNQANNGTTTELIHIGIINIGLKAIAPNTIGSLILNIEGTIDARPKEVNFF